MISRQLSVDSRQLSVVSGQASGVSRQSSGSVNLSRVTRHASLFKSAVVRIGQLVTRDE